MGLVHGAGTSLVSVTRARLSLVRGAGTGLVSITGAGMGLVPGAGTGFSAVVMLVIALDAGREASRKRVVSVDACSALSARLAISIDGCSVGSGKLAISINACSVGLGRQAVSVDACSVTLHLQAAFLRREHLIGASCLWRSRVAVVLLLFKVKKFSHEYEGAIVDDPFQLLLLRVSDFCHQVRIGCGAGCCLLLRTCHGTGRPFGL